MAAFASEKDASQFDAWLRRHRPQPQATPAIKPPRPRSRSPPVAPPRSPPKPQPLAPARYSPTRCIASINISSLRQPRVMCEVSGSAWGQLVRGRGQPPVGC